MAGRPSFQRLVQHDGAVEAALAPRACAPGHVALQEELQEEALGVIDLDRRQRRQGPAPRPMAEQGAIAEFGRPNPYRWGRNDASMSSP